jgi:protein-S-isoprenylcysteine O-methyltransferase Ste14
MSHSDTAHVIAPPPVIFFGIEAIGLLIHWLFPVHFLPQGITWFVGLPLILIGLFIGFTALSAMRRAHTPVDPYEPSTAVVSDGPYRFTRNPIYVSFVVIYLGIASLFNALWPLVLLPVAIIVIDRFVIVREERYLQGKFGEAYIRYKATVRRWL